MLKVCIDCGKEEVVERRRCRECVKKYNRERVKKYYVKEKHKRYGIGICSICGKPMKLNKPNQLTHVGCRKKNTENYNSLKRSNKGNTLSRQMILDKGFLLTKNIIVHHLDENPEHNTFNNFALMSRSNHAKLHRFLQQQWTIFNKSNNSNFDNSWDNIRNQITLSWLETMQANIIKITDNSSEYLKEDFVYLFFHE